MQPTMRVATTVVALLLAAFNRLFADDWPQWRGPQRNGKSSETLQLGNWPAEGVPKVIWRAQIGKGHSTAVVSGGRLFTMGWDGREDTVYCLDAVTGERLWSRSYACKKIHQWPGPRCTPTLDGDTLYTLSQWGDLRAWDAGTGQLRWQRALAESYIPDVDYGFAWSPLGQGELLILPCGTRGLAIRKQTGEIAWGDDGQHGASASPVAFEHNGRRGAALITTNSGRESVSLVGVSSASGKLLWRFSGWGEKWGAACTDLLVDAGRVFVTTAEQHPRSARFSISDGELKEDWSSPHLACYTGGCVLIDDHLYAVDKRGILKCVHWASGKRQWQHRGFGEYGAITAARDKLMIQTSHSGELAIVKATAEGYQSLRRARVFDGDTSTFTAPVLAHGRVYCRSYEGELVCLDFTKNNPG